MENFLRKLLLLSSLLLLLGCGDTSPKTGTLLDYIPEEAEMVLKIANWKSYRSDLDNNAMLKRWSAEGGNFFPKSEELFSNLNPSSESLLAYSREKDSLWNITFISKSHPDLFPIDSIKNKTVETLTIDGHDFKRVTIDKDVAYITEIDSVFIASTSQKILMDISQGKHINSASFNKVFELPSSGRVTALVLKNQISLADSVTLNLPSWSSLDIYVKPESFVSTGIVLASDSISNVVGLFKEQIPQQNDLATVIPLDAKAAFSFTFSDAETLQKNLREFRKDTVIKEPTGIFGSANELGTIDLGQEKAMVLKSMDAVLSLEALARYTTSHSSFRDVDIKAFNEPEMFSRIFSPLVSFDKANYMFQLDNFFIFTHTQGSAEKIISAYQNNSTLSHTSYFENTKKDLGSASSILIYKMQGDISETLAQLFLANLKKGTKPYIDYPLLALQLNAEKNFAHFTLSCREATKEAKNTGSAVAEKFHLNLENPILIIPEVIDGGNVVVQDINNTLHYISENGKVLWSRKINSPILGKIKEVDLGNKASKTLAFATKDNVYLIDRTGKDISGFPLKFKDDITQPLSVFDYDNNLNYRLIVVQDKGVLMYDKTGKPVRGFGFNKTKSAIVQPPVHIRMGSKDYILIAEENGTLNILSRVGKSRVAVDKKFKFSQVPITSEDQTFVVITKDNVKERIGEDGKTLSQNLDVGSNYWFTISGSIKATLDDNILRINGKPAELPLGVYSQPQIYRFDQRYYITITETQENRVYVFDKNAELTKGFPVFGSSEASIGKGGTAKETVISTKGEPNEVIVYKIE